MATGFEKFSKKALAEEGISIMSKTPAKQEEKVSPEAGEDQNIKKAPSVKEKKTGKIKDQEKEETFQMTIVIRMDTKRKLDEMKFQQRRNYKELAEEAFEDLYKKYGK